MKRLLSLLCCALWSVSLSAQLRATLRTNDTVLELEADENAPRLVSIKHAGDPAWMNTVPELLLPFVNDGERRVPLTWKFNASKSKRDEQQLSFVYESQTPHLVLKWRWKSRASFGPIEHTITIQNLSGRELWLPMQDSFRYDLKVSPLASLTHMFVEKGADTPSAIGTHELTVEDGYRWEGISSTYAHKHDDEPREIIPWSMVESGTSGWYVGIEFSGRTRISLERVGSSIHGGVGLNPNPSPYRTRLLPNATFVTPTIFVGAFDGGPDDAGNILRPWVREVLGNPVTWNDPRYPYTVNNSWGSGMAVDEALASRMIHDSAELGLEMFHLDAGWFRGVGDWYPDPVKFPHGLAPVADEAHRLGLKFGLWVNWAQAGTDTEPDALNVKNVPDWLVTDLPPNWKPKDFKGQTTDIGYPPAKQWAEKQIERMVDDFHLDMLEHDGYLVAQGCVRKDHPHAPPNPEKLMIYMDSGVFFARSSNSTDVAYHAVRAYYDIYRKLRGDHPRLLLEVCNDGGRMVDFGSATHADYFSITDTYDPLSNRRAFFDASHVLPAAMLESYIAKWPTPKIANFLYMLRSGMMGWMTIMQDTTAWSQEQHRAAKEEIQLYKSLLRPLIREANLYHISERPDGVHWDGIEYFDQKRGKGVVYAFHGLDPKESSHRFVLKGLRADREYKARFHDHALLDRTIRGRELMRDGLMVELPDAYSSDLIFLDEVNPVTH